MSKQQKQARTRWSELPKWAWAHGLRKNVHFRAEADTDYTEAQTDLPEPTTDINEAQVITSKIEYHDRNPNLGLHRPILDIDFPAALIPSSTEGHFHLYLDKPMEWTVYRDLLRALAAAGIIENGYAQASEARKYTAVRLPWVRKEDAPDEERPDDQPEVELVDRVADEAPSAMRGADTSAVIFDEAARVRTCTCFGAEDGFHNNGCTAAAPSTTISENAMREPLTDDISRMQWASPHRVISYSRLREYFGDRYHELLQSDPTTGNRTWRQACRREQQRQNREQRERAERQEARIRQEHEERQRVLAQDRAERQAQAAPARSSIFPHTWADEIRSARVAPTDWLRPRQAPFELAHNGVNRTIRDNRGRQLTEEELYRAQGDLRISARDLEGPHMEEAWTRCYDYARRNDAVMANLAAAYVRPMERYNFTPEEDRRLREALRIANDGPHMRPSEAPSVAAPREDAAE